MSTSDTRRLRPMTRVREFRVRGGHGARGLRRIQRAWGREITHTSQRDSAGAPADLAVEALLWVVRPDLAPVLFRRRGEGEQFLGGLLEQRGGLREPIAQLLRVRACLARTDSASGCMKSFERGSRRWREPRLSRLRTKCVRQRCEHEPRSTDSMAFCEHPYRLQPIPQRREPEVQRDGAGGRDHQARDDRLTVLDDPPEQRRHDQRGSIAHTRVAIASLAARPSAVTSR